jgi:hypothetical protein
VRIAAALLIPGSGTFCNHPDPGISGDCTIEWIVRDSEKDIVKQRAQCAAPLKRQLPLLLKLGTEFFSNERNAQTLPTLFWGGLESESKPASWELSLRLALAADQSPGWDVKRGKPKKNDINGFVRDLANREMIYPELKELFDGFNRNIRLSTVENEDNGGAIRRAPFLRVRLSVFLDRLP